MPRAEQNQGQPRPGGGKHRVRSQEHPTGKRALRFQKKITFRRIALLSEKLQEFRSCRSYRIKKSELYSGPSLIQIAKDTSFFAIMAVGMTFVIITGGIDLSVGATYAIASVCGALVLSQFGAEGGTGSVLLGILVTIGVGILGGLLNGSMIVAF